MDMGFVTDEVDSDSLSSDSAASWAGEAMSWEQVMLKHRLRAYGTRKDICSEISVTCNGEDERTTISGESHHASPAQRTQKHAAVMSPPPSTLVKSPMAKSRRLVDRIVDSYDGSNPSTPVSSKQKEQKHSKRGHHQIQGDNQNNVDIRANIKESTNQMESKLYDWSTSPLVLIALEGEDDTVVAGMDELLKKVEQHKESTAPRLRSRNSNNSCSDKSSVCRREEEVLAHYPLALNLLLQLHRDLRCPAKLHKAFHAGHCHPSMFNFAIVLSRIFTLFDSRIILLDLIRAASGNPSQKLVARMLKVHKDECSQNKTVETVSTDLLSQLNFAGQSPQQIRNRARATTISIIADSGRTRGREEASGSSRERKDPSQPVDYRQSISQASNRLSTQRKSSLMMSVADIKKDMLSSSSPPNFQDYSPSSSEETFKILRPSEMIRKNETPDPPQPLNIIVESDDEETSGDDNSIGNSDENGRQGLIRMALMTRFPRAPNEDTPQLHTLSGTETEGGDDELLCRPGHAFVPASSFRRRSTRLASFSFHSQMIQMVCKEWLASVPWKVMGFKFAGKVLSKDLRA